MQRTDRVQVEPGSTADEFIVKGRGMLHLGILIENMRREGYEFQVRSADILLLSWRSCCSLCTRAKRAATLQVGPPEVIIKTSAGGKKQEPFDEATVDVPEEYVGACVDLLGSRKGSMKDMVAQNVRFLFRLLQLQGQSRDQHSSAGPEPQRPTQSCRVPARPEPLRLIQVQGQSGSV